MSTAIAYILSLVLIGVSFIASIYVYPMLPSEIAVHWNGAGQVDGYGNKFIGLFLFPAIATIVFLFLVIVPYIDPFRENFKKFRKEYNLSIVLMVFTFMFFNALSLAWNLGIRFNFARAAAPMLGMMFFIMGTILPRTKRNWFFGIRTPWTISSDMVWEKTHKIGGLIVKVSGIIAMFGILVPADFAFVVAIVPLAVSLVWLIIYSYILFRKERFLQ